MKLYSAIYNGFFPFDEMGLFTDFEATRNPEDLEEEGALVVWGGEDISPSLYNKAVGSRTGARDVPSARDQVEWDLMKAAKERGIPIIGICRGAQMLCALEGGFLIQDVTNHGRRHAATTSDGQTFPVSSLHHQMLYPFDVDHELLAWSTEKRSTHYLDVDTPIEVEVEPECVLFKSGIGIQWHPEFESNIQDHSQQWVGRILRERVIG